MGRNDRRRGVGPRGSRGRRRGPALLGLALVALLLSGMSELPALAREGTSAPLVVDGRPLFQVRSSREYSAEVRVERPNALLTEAVRGDGEVDLRLVEKNNLPVIVLNDRPLLTVTRRDTPEGLDPQDQGRIWRRQIARAIERGRRERRPEHLQRMLLLGLLFLLGALGLQRILGFAFRRLFPQAWQPQPEQAERSYGAESTRFLLHAGLRLLQAAVWIAALRMAAELFPFSRIWTQRLSQATADSLASPLLPLGSRSYSVLDVIVLLTLFVLLVKVVGAMQRLLRTRVLRHTGIGAGAQEAIAFILQISLLFIGSLVLLQLWGLDLSSLTLFASVLGVGVGLGLQGITKNFISGLIIIFERPIQVGDFVEVGDLQGTVNRISLRSTEVVTLDRVSIIVPNSEFLESRVINWSHGSTISRLQIPVGVAYGSNCNEVRNALVDACDGYSGILRDPAPRVFFMGFGDSSLNFHLLVWISQPMRQYEITSDLNFRIEAVLRNRNITIPFPQRDVHLSKESLQIALPPELIEAIGRQQSPAAPPRGPSPPEPPTEPP